MRLLIIVGLVWHASAMPMSEKQALNSTMRYYGEFGPYFEGDIILSEEEELLAKQGLKPTAYRWPDKTLSYELDEQFSDEDRASIETGIAMITSTTCVKIVPRSDEETYVKVEKSDGVCNARLGFTNKPAQPMRIDPEGCPPGSIAHEFMHALGIHHEQTRSDRDDYITINFSNIISGMEHNFKKVDPPELWDNFGTKYDYGSVMHYPQVAFSKNGQATIIPKKKGVKIGQREKLSAKDIQLIRAMYKC